MMRAAGQHLAVIGSDVNDAREYIKDYDLGDAIPMTWRTIHRATRGTQLDGILITARAYTAGIPVHLLEEIAPCFYTSARGSTPSPPTP